MLNYLKKLFEISFFGCIFAYSQPMKRKLLLGFGLLTASLFLWSCSSVMRTQHITEDNLHKIQIKRILYFIPEVLPEVEEIKEPTYDVFFNAASDKMMSLGTLDYLRIDIPVEYDNVNLDMIKEFCKNNDADLAIIPRVKYFKVGLGKYVFSNQVEVSLKVFDAHANQILETTYDTYRAGGRMLGSAENSVKIGTKAAIQNMNKDLQNAQFYFVKTS